jgi:hypothetical protein
MSVRGNAPWLRSRDSSRGSASIGPGDLALAMRRSVTSPIDFDSMTDAQLEEWIEGIEERYTDPTCDSHDGEQLLKALDAAREALKPDFGNTIHELNCLWVENYQRSLWERPGHKAHRAFTVVRIQDTPAEARRCQYCFGGLWSPGRPRIQDPVDLDSTASVRAISTAFETNRRRH